jgi:hypothetical protein
MDWLEQELKAALARKDPSPGFAARVEAAARRRPALGVARWVAAAAAMVVMISGGTLAYRRHQGMVAKEQVMLALRITATKLNHIQERVKEVRP